MAGNALTDLLDQVGGLGGLGGFTLRQDRQSPDEIYARNRPYLADQNKSDYFTKLSPSEESHFQDWVKANNVPLDSSETADYDMRGFWKALITGNPIAKSAVDPNDNRLHYPDYWKTPYHQTFSNESQFSRPIAPMWTEDDKLIAPSGKIIFDDRAQ